MTRPLTAGETVLARSVFGAAIDYHRVRLARLGFGDFAVTIGSWITFPLSRPPPEDFTVAPARLQGWLIHELVHVWQFQTQPVRTIASWAAVMASGGYGPGLPGYRYTVPLEPWAALNLEQQASVVEHAFLFRQTGFCPAAPAGASYARLWAGCPF